jgi:putative ABC transport system permease protein
VKAGDTLDGSLARRYRGEKQRVHLPLTVAAVAPPAAFTRDAAFVALPLLEALEDYRDGRAVPRLGWDGVTGGPRTYPSFRLYARSIYDVEALKLGFEQQGIQVRTRAADIELVQRMDQNLARIYWAIAIIGLVGFVLSLSASLWANVDRKRKELSVLRLVGFRTGDIVWFPTVQALFTALLGWALASLIYLGAAEAINQLLADQLAAGQTVCRLLPEHYAVALALTVASAVAAAGMAGWRASRVAPSDGLREL